MSLHRAGLTIERCCGLFEHHRNGTLLSTIETMLEWAITMTRRGLRSMANELRIGPTT